MGKNYQIINLRENEKHRYHANDNYADVNFYLEIQYLTLISISISTMAAMIVRTDALTPWGRSSHDWKGMFRWESCISANVPK